jgi:hypothetical protein
MHPYERWIIRRYLANAVKMKFFHRDERGDTQFFSWTRAHSHSWEITQANEMLT